MTIEKTVENKNYKWVALFLLWVAFFLQQGTRQLFGPSVPAIMNSIGCDKTQLGLVGTVFAMVYGICVPFAGITADIFKRKWMVTIGVGVFCLGIFLSGFIASAGILLITYGILNGFGQTFYYPSATSLISQLHKDSRATAMSLLQLGLYIGIVGCGGLAGWCAGQGGNGWRTPFWVFGGIGIAWAFVLMIFLKDTPPVKNGTIKKEDKDANGEDNVVVAVETKPSISEAIKAVFSKPTALCVAAGLAMMIYVDIGFKNWMPTHLLDTFKTQCPFLTNWAGLHAVLWHYLGAFFGIMIGSRIGDKLVRKHSGIRLELGIIGLGGAIPFIIWMAQASSFTGCCIAMGLFGFFRGVYDSNFMASFFDVVNPRYHASGCGIMMCIAFIFGSFSSTILPVIGKHFTMSTSLTTLAPVYLIGALIILLARVCFLKRDSEL